MLLPVSFAVSAANTTTADASKNELKNLQLNIAEKEKSVKEQQGKRASLLTQLKNQEKDIAAAGRELYSTQKTLKQLENEIATLSTEIKQLDSKQKAQRELLSKQLDAAFRQGRHQGVELIFKGEEGQRDERILAYYTYIGAAREKTIAELEETTQQLHARRQTEQQKRAEQKNLLGKQQTEKKKLDSARVARKSTLTELERSLKADQKDLLVMRENESQLRNKIAKAEREAKARAEREAREAARIREKQAQAKKKGSTYTPTQDERSLMSRTGGLGRPAGQAIWPVRGPLLHRFGDSISGELRWKGMVIGAPEGTQVKAVADGRVLLADWLQGYGLVVVVEHGKGDMSLYGYNQSALVNVGDQVKAGQPVALVGNSGGQERPGLYFEIRRQGRTVNPQPWLGR
ncbi:murein hydrolase activator EnvC [Morganella morganii]|uniref:Murein hydrolase activator EnvC n=1 Tax=Morganella morganii TaxID=582 RepID=A0A9Q4CPS4_MORMO|nr:murein hydrolase activator EnvC [Morganella morganii]MCY0791193.1 murein hydrolase activator EnvC [Morganella morganii]MDM8752555.1 murein hydrolase activator EnvC [Morganella morganii]WNP32577.1 murein hydrolase activator EnvC [Morganella morganii]